MKEEAKFWGDKLREWNEYFELADPEGYLFKKMFGYKDKNICICDLIEKTEKLNTWVNENEKARNSPRA